MEYHSLAPPARTLFHLQSLIRLFILWTPMIVTAVVVYGIFVSVWWGLVIGCLIWICVAIGSVWLPSFAYDRWGYLILDDVLLITWGVLFRNVVAIPLHRIQHVDTHQGPFDQIFGLARLQIYTASGMGADGVIPGLFREVAEEMRAQLVTGGGDDGV